MAHKYLDKPEGISVEVTNNCNLKCVTCANQYMKRKRGFMSMRLFKKVVDECASEGIKHLNLYTRGEPLLHPELIDMISYAKLNGLRTSISTNGVLLTKELIKKLVFSGVDRILVSIEGADKKTYESIRVGGDFDKLYNNIKYMKLFRDYHKRTQSPEIFIRCLVIKQTVGQAQKFFDVWGDLCDAIIHSVAQDEAGQVPDLKDILVGDIISSPKKRRPCSLFYTLLLVNWNGKVTPCCVDFNDNLIVGDFNKESLVSIWRGKTINKYRALLEGGHYDKVPLCRSCFPRKIGGFDYCLHIPWQIKSTLVFDDNTVCPVCGVVFHGGDNVEGSV